jgi:DNA-binding NarL/FixJ family response regulator
MTNSELFDKYLIDFQPDLKRIIGKHRFDNHQLGEDEVLSEINVYLLKKKDNIIDYRDEERDITEFTHIGFKKAAFSYARNLIKWTHMRKVKSPFVRRRADGIHTTDQGQMTTFEMMCETLGEEDDGFEFDSSAKSKYVVKLLTEYSNLLTPNESKIIELMEKGKNQYTIGEELGVTHQAVSIAVIKLVRKIRSHLKFDYKTDSSSHKVTKGRNSIKSLFGFDGGLKRFSSQDSKDLIHFLKNNHKKRYSLDELTESFKNGMFDKKQIMGVINFNSLGSYIRKKVQSHSKYTKEESNLIIKMANDGSFIDDIAKALNRRNRQISCKCSNLFKNKLISFVPKTKLKMPKYSKKDSKKILEMFKKGLTSQEIGEILNTSAQSVGGKRAYFCKKGLIPLAKKTIRNRKCASKQT